MGNSSISNNSIYREPFVCTQCKCENSSICNNSIYREPFVCTQCKCENSSIQPTERTLSVATIPEESGPGSNGNAGILLIPQSSSITGISPLDCLMSYHWEWGASYLSAEMQLVYSTAPADRAKRISRFILFSKYLCYVKYKQPPQELNSYRQVHLPQW